MRSGYTQDGSPLALNTALGENALLLDSLRGTEGLSQLFRYTLTMRAHASGFSAADLIGTAASVVLRHDESRTRHLHGIVSRFTYLGMQADFALYTLELVPKLWLLSLGRDRVIYQNMSAADIVRQVLNEFSIAFDDRLSASYTAREYCVRYDETALDFISRLMEEEGIFYYFIGTQAAHTMVLADGNGAMEAIQGAPLVMRHEARQIHDAITRFEWEGRLVTRTHAVDDYNYLTPSTALLASSAAPVGHGASYEFAAGHSALAQGNTISRIRAEQQRSEHLLGHGDSHCAQLAAGFSFTLEGHPRTELNIEHAVRAVEHEADWNGYVNRFETQPLSVPFRPARVTPRPMVAGSHTAQVVGPQGEEIWTDSHGRVKLQFPWDRQGKRDGGSSCWVRVSQAWAGQNWGALFLPRVGHEVVVSYVDGDPSRPLITGSVYNAEHQPPVGLPGASTQSTMLSRSTKRGTAGNEMRFEDKKDAEELYMHAQKDMRVAVENDLSTTVMAGNETHTVSKGDRTVSVEKGKETHSVKGTRTLTVTGAEEHQNKADFSHQVTGNYSLKVQGNLTIEVTGTLLIKSAQSVDIQAGTNLSSKAQVNVSTQAGVELVNKGGVSLSNEAPMIASKASGIHNVEAGGVLALKGALVKLN